jgi:aminocarboxymuconate-semialdehyde decarboxylase
MKTRRDFLKDTARAAGVIFTSCSLLDAAPARAQAPAKKRLPVMVKGTRVKTHRRACALPDSRSARVAAARMKRKGIFPRTKGAQQFLIALDERLAAWTRRASTWRFSASTRGGIARSANSPPRSSRCRMKGWRRYAQSSRTASRRSPRCRCSFPILPCSSSTTPVRKYGLKGAAIGGSVGGVDFSEPQFHPVWAKAEELGVTLFIHPQSTPQLASRFKGNGWLSNVIGNPLDTTIALQHLIFEGLFDKYPRLKVCAAHGGGYLGSYAPRSDHGCFISPENCNPNIVLKKKPTEYLNQIFFDALVFTPEALRHLVAQVGASQVVIGTDHPIPWEEHPVDHIMATKTLSDEQMVAILGGNAAKLLNIKA